MKNKKGQITLADAPSVVLIVGLIFLIMATVAYIGQKYGDAIDSSLTKTVLEDNLGTVDNVTGKKVSFAGACNFADFSISAMQNGTTGIALNSNNYTYSSDGTIKTANAAYASNPTLVVNYSFSYAGIACNVTKDLQTEISDNTSIAGIVLTISLVGIVLTVLIGVFLAMRVRRI
jgi:hypothetical protein